MVAQVPTTHRYASMLLTLQSLTNTISDHPWLTLFLFILTGILVLRYFSDVALDEVFAGVFRLLGSIFVAPFHFIRAAMKSMAGFTSNDTADSGSRTYLLHRSIEYSRLAALVGAILIVAVGMTVAVIGVWPSEQLNQRREYKEGLARVDSPYAADSVRLQELSGAQQQDVAKKRAATRDSLRLRRTTISTSVSRFWESTANWTAPDQWDQRLDSAYNAVRVSTADSSAFVASRLIGRLRNSAPGGSVWDDTPYQDRYSEDSALIATGPDVKKALASLVKADSSWKELRGGFLLALSAVETQHALVNALRLGTIEQEIEALKTRMDDATLQRNNYQYALKAIDWFSGVKFFFLTVFYTYLLFIAFVWAVGLAIETTLLLVGIARDIAALRKRGE